MERKRFSGFETVSCDSVIFVNAWNGWRYRGANLWTKFQLITWNLSIPIWKRDVSDKLQINWTTTFIFILLLDNGTLLFLFPKLHFSILQNTASQITLTLIHPYFMLCPFNFHHSRLPLFFQAFNLLRDTSSFDSNPILELYLFLLLFSFIISIR